MSTALDDGLRVIARAGGAVPFGYDVSETGVVTVTAAHATFDGIGASGAFLPCLAFYSQNGVLLGRYFPDTGAIAAGASGDVSYAPFLGGGGGGGGTAAAAQWAEFSSAAAASPRAWTLDSSTDPTLFYVDGADNTKIRVAKPGVYLVLLQRTGPQVAIATPYVFGVTMFTNGGVGFNTFNVIDWDDASAADNAQINHLNGSRVYDASAETDTPFYIQVATAPVAAGGNLALQIVQVIGPSAAAAVATADYVSAPRTGIPMFTDTSEKSYPADYLAIGNSAMYQDDGSGRVEIIEAGLYELTMSAQLASATIPASVGVELIAAYTGILFPNTATHIDPGNFAFALGQDNGGGSVVWDVWQIAWLDINSPPVTVEFTILTNDVSHTAFDDASASVRVVKLTEASMQGT